MSVSYAEYAADRRIATLYLEKLNEEISAATYMAIHCRSADEPASAVVAKLDKIVGLAEARDLFEETLKELRKGDEDDD